VQQSRRGGAERVVQRGGQRDRAPWRSRGGGAWPRAEEARCDRRTEHQSEFGVTGRRSWARCPALREERSSSAVAWRKAMARPLHTFGGCDPLLASSNRDPFPYKAAWWAGATRLLKSGGRAAFLTCNLVKAFSLLGERARSLRRP
jgi:hypothetical protein